MGRKAAYSKELKFIVSSLYFSFRDFFQYTPCIFFLSTTVPFSRLRYRPQHFLNFFPLPQGQGSFRPIFFLPVPSAVGAPR